MKGNNILLIETARCRIRPFEEKDLDIFTDYRNNEDWMRYQGYKNKSREEYSAFLLGKNDSDSGMQLALADRESDTLIGDIYIKYETGAYALGYSLHPAHTGSGLMTEALTALIKELNSDINAGVLPDNRASKSLLKRLGFTYLHEAEGEEVYIYKAVK